MSGDLSDCDGDFEGLKLKQISSEVISKYRGSDIRPTSENVTLADEHENEKKDDEKPVCYESTFTSSFLSKNMASFPTTEAENRRTDEDPPDDHSEDSDIRWDTANLYKNISSVETNRENEVCVLRLVDTISNMDIAGQQMTEQLLKYGSFIQSKTGKEMEKLGYKDIQNHQVLDESFRALKSTIRLLSLEVSELRSVVDESIYPADSPNRLRVRDASKSVHWNFSKIINITLTTACVFIVAKELHKAFVI